MKQFEDYLIEELEEHCQKGFDRTQIQVSHLLSIIRLARERMNRDLDQNIKTGLKDLVGKYIKRKSKT
jgi:hypothetical protein